MSSVLYTQILKQSVLKPASPGITLNSSNTTSVTFGVISTISVARMKISTLTNDEKFAGCKQNRKSCHAAGAISTYS